MAKLISSKSLIIFVLPPKLTKEKLLKYFVTLHPFNVLNPTTNHIIIVFERQASIVMTLHDSCVNFK